MNLPFATAAFPSAFAVAQTRRSRPDHRAARDDPDARRPAAVGLSVFSARERPWPAVFEQRYADLRGGRDSPGRRQAGGAGGLRRRPRQLPRHAPIRRTWVGYRALGWGELKDGYDTCEWLAKQPWAHGQGRHVRQLAGRLCRRILGGHAAAASDLPVHGRYGAEPVSRRLPHRRHDAAASVSRRWTPSAAIPDDNRRLLEEWFRHPHYDDYWRAGRLLAALRQDERALLHDRQLVRLHEPGLDRQLSRPAAAAAARTRAASSNSSSARGCTAG